MVFVSESVTDSGARAMVTLREFILAMAIVYVLASYFIDLHILQVVGDLLRAGW